MGDQVKSRIYSAQSSSLQESGFRGHPAGGSAGDCTYGTTEARTGAVDLRLPLPTDARYHRIADNDSILKNLFDRCGAAFGLLVLSPLLLMVAGLIYFSNPGPVLFAHERIGKLGRRFKCLKFRTMITNGDAVLAEHLRNNPDAENEWNETRKLQDDPRVTPLGDALRRSSLDELPQLFNILAGQMSIVGPRPIIDSETIYYGDAIYDYLSVRPGLTGLWQVSGRSDVGYGQRVALDSDYVRSRTMLGDCAIILRTVKVVALREGSY